jgi:hypothetical protein
VISIRRARADDVDFLHGLVNDDDVEPFLGGRAALDRESLLREIERSDSEPQEFGRFVIEADGERAGTMGFEVANRRSQIARLDGAASPTKRHVSSSGTCSSTSATTGSSSRSMPSTSGRWRTPSVPASCGRA